MAAVVLLLWPALIGGKVLTARDMNLFSAPWAAERPADLATPSNPGLRDPTDIFEPGLFAARQAIRAGELPTWNPSAGAGRPLLASQQAAVLSPLQSPAYVLPFWDALAISAALKLLIAAFGTYFFCRMLGLARPAATIGGLAFALGTGFVAFLEHPEANMWCFLPWLLIALDRLCRTGGVAPALLLGLGAGTVLLGGHPESGFVMALYLGAYAAMRLVLLRRDGRLRPPALRRRAALVLAAAVLAVGVSAIVTVPFLEALGQSTEIERATNGDDARILLGSVFPDRWGRSDKGPELHGVELSYPARALYIGALPLLVAIGGLFARGAAPVPRRRTMWFFAATVPISLAIVLAGPVNSLVGKLPVFSIMVLHWFVWPAVFAGPVLAAYGLHRLLASDAPGRRRILAVMAGAAVVPLLVQLVSPGFSDVGAAVQQLPDLKDGTPSFELASTTSALRWAIAAGAACAVVAAVVLRPRLRARIAWVLVALTAVDLVVVNFGYHPAVDERLTTPEPAAIRAVRTLQGSARMAASNLAFRPNAAILYGLRDVRGSDLPALRRHTKLYRALDGSAFVQLGRNLVEPRRPRVPQLLDVFAARYLIDDGTGPPSWPGFRVVSEQSGQRVFENRSALPRAWVAYGWQHARDEGEALRLTVASTRSTLERRPVIEGSPPPARADAPPPSPATIADRGPTEVEVHLSALTRGYVVLQDTHYPGWSAKVDGRDAPIVAANAAFRAVRVPPGTHTVSFRYRPLSVTVGAALTLISLAIIGGGLVWAALRRRRLRAVALGSGASSPPAT
ncbi:MAG TPA: YfhO family protein [Thermoleophilaceae bacterium]|nr:YfhO family protein [Thermoleophilaceae bacterium]